LVTYGLNFPKFAKKPLDQVCPYLGTIDARWIELIDGLTEIDPWKRMPLKKAIYLVK
jgi:hypothetical protein